MNSGFVLFFVLIFGYGINCKQLPTDACSLCNLVVDGLEKFVSQKISKQEIIKQLDIINKEVCTKIPANSYVSSEECSAYVTLYGPYFIDMLLSSTQPNAVCSSMGLCVDDNDKGEKYDIIFPHITESSIEYDVKQTTLALGGEQSFKMFLGSPCFLSDERLSIFLNKYEKDNCGFSMMVTNKTNYSYNAISPPTFNNCTDKIYHPGRGVWYYITVAVNEKTLTNSISDCSFSIKSTVKNVPHVNPTVNVVSHTNILLVILFPLLCVSIALCCCCCARRRCKSKCRAMKNCQAIQLETLEAATPTEPPVGYYYVPVGAGQYIQVPQNMMAQQLPYPVQQE